MIEVKVRDGKVIVSLDAIDTAIEPQLALEMGEALARAAHACRYGVRPGSNIKAHIRDRLINRIALTLKSIQDKPTGYVAATVVDIVLAEAL